MMTEQDYIDAIENIVAAQGGYLLIEETNRPLVPIIEDGKMKYITIKSLSLVAENKDFISLKAIDTNDEMWDVDDYCDEHNLGYIYEAITKPSFDTSILTQYDDEVNGQFDGIVAFLYKLIDNKIKDEKEAQRLINEVYCIQEQVEDLIHYISEDDLEDCADTFTIDECEYAYQYGGSKTTFHDYADCDQALDEQAYYSDFKKWWLSLPTETQREIYFKINNK